MNLIRLNAVGRITLAPTPEQQEVLTAALSVLTAAPAGPIPDIPPGEYRWTSDAIMFCDVEAHASTGRVIMEAAGFGHRELPLPYQANLDTNSWGHEGAENVGRMDTVSESGGSCPASGFLTVSEDGEGREYVLAVALGNVPGVSVDAAVLEHTMKYEVDEEGFVVDAVVIAHQWEIMGLTGTPFPAFADARVSVEGVVEEEMPEEDMPAMAASAATAPPASWFEDPQLDRPTPLTLDGDRVFGHIAPWEQAGSRACHVGFADHCVCAPPSPDGAYPFFLSGPGVTCADGTKMPAAPVAFSGGHVPDDGTQPWTSVKANYDDPARVGLLVNVGEDKHGVWFAGMVSPTLTAAQRVVLEACGISGHWRSKIQGDPRPGERLIAACCVLAEGFPKSLVASLDPDDMPAVASGPVAVYDSSDERLSLVAATGTAVLAAAHNPASKGDVAVLAADLADACAELATMRRLLDGTVREAAVSALG